LQIPWGIAISLSCKEGVGACALACDIPPADCVTPPSGSVPGPAPGTPPDPAAWAVAEQDAARVTRKSALGAVAAVLLGLIGSVIGGWMALGEPMTFTFHRIRQGITTPRTP